VRSEVLVSLLVSGVFWDEVKVFSADDEGTVHLGGNDCASQDTATDGNETGERALLVYKFTGQLLFANSTTHCILFSRSWFQLGNVIPRLKLPSLPLSKSLKSPGIDLPMYVPSIAVFGVRKPRPTSLYHLRPPFPTLVDFAFDLLLRKM
jgi:hypothetical protein